MVVVVDDDKIFVDCKSRKAHRLIRRKADRLWSGDCRRSKDGVVVEGGFSHFVKEEN